MTIRQRLCSDGGRQKARLCRTVQVCGPSPQEHEILIAVLAQVGLRDPLRRGDSSARAPYRLPPIRSRGKPNCAPISPQCPAHSLVVLRAQPPISSPVHPFGLSPSPFRMPGSQPSRCRIVSALRVARSLSVSRWLRYASPVALATREHAPAVQHRRAPTATDSRTQPPEATRHADRLKRTVSNQRAPRSSSTRIRHPLVVVDSSGVRGRLRR